MLRGRGVAAGGGGRTGARASASRSRTRPATSATASSRAKDASAPVSARHAARPTRPSTSAVPGRYPRSAPLPGRPPLRDCSSSRPPGTGSRGSSSGSTYAITARSRAEVGRSDTGVEVLERSAATNERISPVSSPRPASPPMRARHCPERRVCSVLAEYSRRMSSLHGVPGQAAGAGWDSTSAAARPGGQTEPGTYKRRSSSCSASFRSMFAFPRIRIASGISTVSILTCGCGRQATARLSRGSRSPSGWGKRAAWTLAQQTLHDSEGFPAPTLSSPHTEGGGWKSSGSSSSMTADAGSSAAIPPNHTPTAPTTKFEEPPSGHFRGKSTNQPRDSFIPPRFAGRGERVRARCFDGDAPAPLSRHSRSLW